MHMQCAYSLSEHLLHRPGQKKTAATEVAAFQTFRGRGAGKSSEPTGYTVFRTVKSVPVPIQRLAQHFHGTGVEHLKIMPPSQIDSSRGAATPEGRIFL